MGIQAAVLFVRWLMYVKLRAMHYTLNLDSCACCIIRGSHIVLLQTVYLSNHNVDVFPCWVALYPCHSWLLLRLHVAPNSFSPGQQPIHSLQLSLSILQHYYTRSQSSFFVTHVALCNPER
jgi:hypothetical protein